MPDDTPRVLDLQAERIKRGNYVQDFAWEDPQDPFVDARPVDFPVQVLPQVIGDYVSDQADRMGADIGMAAMFALAGVSSAIDDRIKIQPKRNDPSWRESCRVWVAAVGPPAIMKSPTLRAMMIPIKRQDMLWQDDDIAAGKQSAIEQKIYNKQMNAAISARAKGEHCDLPEPPEERERHHAMVEDHTIEGLRKVLEHSARGTLIHTDELSGFFGSQDAYRERGVAKDGPLYLELYDGGRKGFTRANAGTVTVPNWGASIVGGIQPEPMGRIASRLQDDGLLQRFNVFMAKPCTGGHDRVRSAMAFDAYSNTFKRLFEIQPSDVPIMFGDDAYGIFLEFCKFVQHAQVLPIFQLKLRSHIAKWRGQFARYCLLLHALECSANGVHPADHHVSGKSAESASSLFMTYLLQHARAFYHDVIGGDVFIEHTRWVAGFILSRGLDSIDRRQIRMSYRGMRNASDEDVHLVMDNLSLFDWVTSPDDRKPHQKWFVNPRVKQKFARKAEDERVSRDAQKALLRELFGSQDSPEIST